MRGVDISVRSLEKSYRARSISDKAPPRDGLLRLKRPREVFWALRDVSFDVGTGEALGVIGANGSGKTTLIKLLSGVTAPSGGTIILRGRLVSLVEVGAGFHGDLTGRENIYLNG